MKLIGGFMKKKFILFITVLFVSVGIFAGPFGLDMGMTFDDLNREEIYYNQLDVGVDTYFVIPPLPHNEFESYVIRVDPDEGIYFILALSSDIEDSGYGYNTKDHFDNLRYLISRSYGSNEMIEYLMSDSIWNEDIDWMMSLLQEDRIHLAIWSEDSGAALPEDIEEIQLGATANSSNVGIISLSYYGPNFYYLNEKSLNFEASVF